MAHLRTYLLAGLIAGIAGQGSALVDDLGLRPEQMREDRWKLIEYHVNGRITRQLFDTREDPWELHNLIDDPACAEHVERLAARLREGRDLYADAGEHGQRYWGEPAAC